VARHWGEKNRVNFLGIDKGRQTPANVFRGEKKDNLRLGIKVRFLGETQSRISVGKTGCRFRCICEGWMCPVSLSNTVPLMPFVNSRVPG